MRCDVDGLDDIIADLKRFGDESEDMAEEMLETAGEVMEDEWREEIERRGLVDTGSMRDSVKTTVNKGKKTADTYPRKKDKKGTSNAAKAFIAHHGKAGHQKATYFVNDIQEKGGARAHAAMQQVLDKKLKEKGL